METSAGHVTPRHRILRIPETAWSTSRGYSSAHLTDARCQVELPFLQSLQPNLKFVLYAAGTGRVRSARYAGPCDCDVIAAHTAHVLIVASSDINHLRSDSITRAKTKCD